MSSPPDRIPERFFLDTHSMVSFILILLTVAFTALVIFYLHKNHLRKTLEIAENTNTLAPLESDLMADPTSEGIRVVNEIEHAPQKNLTWSEEIKTLRDSGCFLEALALSKRQYPKLLAYRQSLITLRARLKQESAYSEESLSDLYQTAVSGDLVKIKSTGVKSPGDINKALIKLGSPREYWNTLGYKKLALLTKTDRRLLVKYWGEPEHHCAIDSLISLQSSR
mgnify:CR=1 FL=1